MFLFLLFFSFLAGIFATLGLAFWLFNVFYLENTFSQDIPYELSYERAKLPEKLNSEEIGHKIESCEWLNIFLAFLFNEIKDKAQVRKWVIKKINVEFDELLSTRTAGRLIEQLTLREIALGSSLPVFDNIQIGKMHPKTKGCIPEELDIEVDVDYTGGFWLSVEADLLFDKSAYVKIKLNKLKGRGILRFTRQPYTHWAFVFIKEPLMEFETVTHVQGRNISQLGTLIINQLKKSIKKKHTLPNYKLRFKPFFTKPIPPLTSEPVYFNDIPITAGQLHIHVLECSRLPKMPQDSFVYCNLGVGPKPWQEEGLDTGTQARTVVPSLTLEVELIRDKNSTPLMGILMGSRQHKILLTSVEKNSPAALADLQKDDMLLEVDGVKVVSLNHAVSLLTKGDHKKLVKVERICGVKRVPSKLSMVAKTPIEDNDYEEFINADISKAILNVRPEGKMDSLSKTAATSTTATQELNSQEKVAHFVMEAGDTTKFESTRLPNGGKVPVPEGARRRGSISSSASTHNFDTLFPPSSDNDMEFGFKKTFDVPANSDPAWDQKLEFEVSESDQYLNLCLWNKVLGAKKDKLVGYYSVDLMDIVLNCISTTRSEYLQSYPLEPPTTPTPPGTSRFEVDKNLSGHRGYEERLCYGDITLLFQYFPNNRVKSQNTDDPSDPSNDPELGAYRRERKPSINQIESDINKRNDPVLQCRPTTQHASYEITTFPSGTRCDLCKKRIWTKNGMQCPRCALICHKKCAYKATADTICLESGAKWTGTYYPVLNATMEHERRKAEAKEQKSKPKGQTLTTSIPPQFSTSAPSSLRSSLASTPNESPVDSENDDDEILNYAHRGLLLKKQLLRACGYNINEEPEDAESVLLAAAKELGRDVYSEMPPIERLVKLQNIVDGIQRETDVQNHAHKVLEDEERNEPHEERNKARRTAIKLILAEKEQTLNHLSLAMLYYCTAMQDAAARSTYSDEEEGASTYPKVKKDK